MFSSSIQYEALQLEKRIENRSETICGDWSTRIGGSQKCFKIFEVMCAHLLPLWIPLLHHSLLDEVLAVPAVSPYELPKLSRAEYRYMGVESDDLIEECQLIHPSYGSDRCGHSVMWIPVFDSMGLPNNCYAINSFIGNLSIKPYTTLSKAYVIIKLRTETSDTFYTSTPSAIQMSVHNSRDYLNPFKKGISLKPCFNYNMFISKTINELLPYPYATNCTDYLELWKARGGFGPLSKTQCREECLLNVSLKEAGCVDPIYIYYPNEAKMCDHPAMSNFYYKQCADSCNRACNRENIRVAVEEYASLLSLRDKDGVEQCSSVITLAFNRMELKKFSYYPKYERVDLFGIIGGYLGVWLGISLLAVTDLLETLFVIIKVIKEAIQKRKKKSNWLSKDDYLQNRYHADSRGNFRLKIY
ncbi:uncharacterized protein CDAR_316141 [Caerostris darwini]|uniref:Uncharacterized protein n=1 Tax=Caerostris darwini TaxID=1538125 RepID=A0AAV4Q9X9_9ARAC|nr:uncharacterized protein CDAR_316141 [Caerostris darwini]